MDIFIFKEISIFDLNDISEFTPAMLEISLKRYMPIPSRDLAQIVNNFWTNSDHGLSHSKVVWQRCQKVISESPLLWQLAKMQVGGSEEDAKRVLILASIFHDLARFLGAPFEFHEWQSAEIAEKTLSGSSLNLPVCYAIINHDYINPLVNGFEMPQTLILPLSEIFRLADKTSVSPKDEIIRYHRTGKRIAPDLPLFDPTISDDVRFNLSSGTLKGDELSWFLILFALQSTDFLYGDTRDAYAYWARGKREALDEIGNLCLEDEYLEGKAPVDPEEAKVTVVRFCKKNNLIISA